MEENKNSLISLVIYEVGTENDNQILVAVENLPEGEKLIQNGTLAIPISKSEAADTAFALLKMAYRNAPDIEDMALEEQEGDKTIRLPLNKQNAKIAIAAFAKYI